MGVLKPRKKMVSLRLADDEYERLIALCSVEGAHSVSDLARVAVCEYLLNRDKKSANGSNGGDLSQKVEKLEKEVRRLSRMASAATAGGG
jgi:hypothetical protein